MAISNGDFEDGDLTDWDNGNTGSGTYSGTQTVTTGSKRSGTYGCRLYAAAQSEGYVHSWIETELPTTGWDDFSFWMKFDNLDLDFTGFTQFEVIVTFLVDSTPTQSNIFLDSAKNCTNWREFRVLFDECDQARIAGGGVWDTTIPIRFSLYVYNEEGTSKENVVFLDDIDTGTIAALTNGDFEDGNLNEFLNESFADVDNSTVDNGAATAAASGTEKHAGSYGAKLNCTAYEASTAWDVESGVSLPIAVADFNSLNFWYKITDDTGSGAEFVVQVLAFETTYHNAQWITVYTIPSFAAGSWTEVNVTKAAMESILSGLGFEFGTRTQIKFVSKLVYIPI